MNDIIITHKRCPRCKLEKSLDDFGMKKVVQGDYIYKNHQSYCMPCRVTYNKQKNIERKNRMKDLGEGFFD